MDVFRYSIATSFLKLKLTPNILGILYFSLLIVFAFVSLPFMLTYRAAVILLAKLFRPDLGDILNGQSTLLVGDYMAKTTPRSNIVMPMIIQGQLTLDEIRGQVIKNWISVSKFENFQRYPELWLGLPFWKRIPKPFSVEDYVHLYSGKQVEVTDEELNEFVETLLNKNFSKYHSPWELHLIENYRISSDQYKLSKQKESSHCVLIMKWHHCLVDGTGVNAALVEGLFQQHWKRVEPTLPPKQPLKEMLSYFFAFPRNMFNEFSYHLSHTFIRNPFKVPHESKEWYQVYARSGLISNQLIKNIKKVFGVSYASILLSAISAAVHKTKMQKSESVLLLHILPASGVKQRKILTNHWTGTSVDLPTTSFKSPVERVKSTSQLFEDSKCSVKPGLLQTSFICSGMQIFPISELIGKNRMFSMGLTNIAGVQEAVKVTENSEWIHTRMAVGGLSGDCGIVVAAFSHGKNTELHVTAEKALMTRQKAQDFVNNVKQEVKALGALIDNSQYYD